MKLTILTIVSIVFFAITSCSSVKQIEYIKDTVIVNNLEYKYIHDSIYKDRYHIQYMQGDTVYIYDSIYISQLMYKYDTVVRDSTVYKDKYTKINTVKTKTKYPIWLMILSGIFGLYFIYKNKGTIIHILTNLLK